MKHLVLVVTLAIVAIQLTLADKVKDTTPPHADAAPRAADVKADEGITIAAEKATPRHQQEPPKGSAVAEKAQ